MRKSWVLAAVTAVLAGATVAGLGAYAFSGDSPQSEVTVASATTSAGEPDGAAAAAAGVPSGAAPTSPAPNLVAPSSAGANQLRKPPTLSGAPTREPHPELSPPPVRRPHPMYSSNFCPFHQGVDAPKADVRVALETAAATKFWTTSQVDLPPMLMKATAWQESGWQSTIIACDGGIGTMQIMPDTEEWMNQRFGTDYSARTLTGNTMIASAYFQWLIKWFGDNYFDGSYVLNTADCAKDPNVPDYKEPCLLNAVIASYNWGYGGVGTATGIVIPNPQYVSNVRALMVSCPCSVY
ncbi:lytic transglycosylase domain-containing protein [Hamadaea sp. NPDC050747]|uniref:lytic transglycosylase domain-containing protein n=1 Tax=Hamadaea sp. NPDC050747 TaxID=3155789 RepID=UPI0034008428